MGVASRVPPASSPSFVTLFATTYGAISSRRGVGMLVIPPISPACDTYPCLVRL